MNQSSFPYTEQNRRAWNEIARVREKIFPPASFFASGGSNLEDRVVKTAQSVFKDLSRIQLIHLQCATGEETLSWVNSGVRMAVGVDISDQQIDLARQKAEAAGSKAKFVASDIYQLPESLPATLPFQYDLVYTGGGALVWLPDIRRWAGVVSKLLKPGGRLLLMEEHPISSCLGVNQGQLEIISNYFDRSNPEISTGWSHFQGGEGAKETKAEFSWPLGDILNSLIQAGLTLECVNEYPGGPEWRYGELVDQSKKLPGEFLLMARK